VIPIVDVISNDIVIHVADVVRALEVTLAVGVSYCRYPSRCRCLSCR
jgi:hypothetical protein